MRTCVACGDPIAPERIKRSRHVVTCSPGCSHAYDNKRRRKRKDGTVAPRALCVECFKPIPAERKARNSRTMTCSDACSASLRRLRDKNRPSRGTGARRYDTIMRRLLSGPTPCDACTWRARCAAEPVACHAFLRWINRPADAVDIPADLFALRHEPTREWYDQVFDGRQVPEGTPTRMREHDGLRSASSMATLEDYA